MKYKEKKKLYPIIETDKGEMVRKSWVTLHDGDSQLDATTMLATLPDRLIQIGYKLLDGEKLSEADHSYWTRQKAKLGGRKYANRLSDEERRRILGLHRQGISMSSIAKRMGRTNKAIMQVLAKSQPLSRQEWLAEMKAKAKERDEQIRHAYLVDGKSVTQIAREFHYGKETVRTAVGRGQTKE